MFSRSKMRFGGGTSEHQQQQRGDKQVYVSVVFDFEYLGEDGKKVFMKENEVLLLINKTNRDWWQVIRRGDRKPFFAPAKYVAELRTDDFSNESSRRLSRHPESDVVVDDATGSHAVRLRQHKMPPPMSTFSAVTHNKIFNGNSNGNNKRSSFNPSAQHDQHEMLFGCGGGDTGSKFQERYRSNSLDSILYADLNNRVTSNSTRPPLENRNSALEIKTSKHQKSDKKTVVTDATVQSKSLEKRPTFDSLDKRKSWSVDGRQSASSYNLFRNAKDKTGLQMQQQQNNLVVTSKGRISAYQNTHSLFGAKLASSSSASTTTTTSSTTGLSSTLGSDKRKKPVPLPRSKVPSASTLQLPQQPSQQQQSQELRSDNDKTTLHSRFFSKRSKTDLGSDGLAAYKANRPKASPTKYPAPKVPTFNRPVPQKRSDDDTSVEERVSLTRAKGGLFVKRANADGGSRHDGERISKPEIKDKPAFSTFKSQLSVPATSSSDISGWNAWRNKRMSKTVSESDLLKSLREEEADQETCVPVLAEETVNVVPVSVFHAVENKTEKSENVVQETDNISNLVIDTNGPDVEQILSESNEICSTNVVDREVESMSEVVTTLVDSVEEINEQDKSTGLDMSIESVASRTKSPSVSTMSRSPPSPEPTGLTPTKQHVVPDWDEYEDTQSGRKFYHNKITKEKSWKPPRKPRGSNDSGGSNPTSPLPEDSPGSNIRNDEKEDNADVDEDETVINADKNDVLSFVEVPNGYELKKDLATGSSYFVNVFTGVRWFSAKDAAGKEYFYEENGNESCWCLPNVSQSIQDNDLACNSTSRKTSEDATASRSHAKKPLIGSTKRIAENYKAMQQNEVEEIVDTPCNKSCDVSSQKSGIISITHPRNANVGAISKMELLERRFALPVSTPHFHIGNVQIVVLKQGPLNKTKILENGKRHRKNWSTAHVVLTDTFLLFFKDHKAFAQMQQQQSSGAKPELCIDLKGTTVDWCTGDRSKRSNVFEVTSLLLGLTILIQHESLQTAAEWFQEIKETIEALDTVSAALVSASDALSERKMSDTAQASSTLSYATDKRKTNSNASEKSRVNRTKSLKMKIMGSDDFAEQPIAAGASSAPIVSSVATNMNSQPTKTNIREKLRKFFLRRPTMDDLFKKGIIKNEPVFGSTLRELQTSDGCDVPIFVRRCIAEIEKGDLLRTDGVYRQSGNLSHIQKIRLQVDQGNLAILESVDDVHVLTGALKLFFRELKDPLIPWECVDRLLRAVSATSSKHRIKQIRDVVIHMPLTHRATLESLLRHLTKVTELKEFNRMQVPNLAIVFGPTLMWPPATQLLSANLALDMMQQNIIVENFLLYFPELF